jgi:PAS domain S-box-containing protein
LLLVSRVATAVIFVFDLAGLNSFSWLNLNLFTVVIAAVIYSIVFFGFGILDPIPTAHGVVIEQMHEGVLVLDIQQRIVDMNPSAGRILGLSLTIARGRQMKQILPALASLDEGQREIAFREGGAVRHYALHHSALMDSRGFPLGTLILFHDVTEQKHAQEQLLEQGRAIATLEERQHLARELHDNIGQVLGYVGFQVEAARQLFSKGQALEGDAQLARLSGIAQGAHADVREFILNLRMGPSQNQPFFPALRQYVNSFSMQYGIQAALSIGDELKDADFGSEARLQIFRIIQEALSNARRHAAARTVQVIFQAMDCSVCVKIQDDGCGFDVGRPTRRNGFGLDFMRERAERLGGDLQIQSKPGLGTCVIVEVPLGTGVPL